MQQKVKELTQRVSVLVVENEALRAEVEIYRKEAALPNFSKLALGEGRDDRAIDNVMSIDDKRYDDDEFVRSGDGIFPQTVGLSIQGLHGHSNPLCCALSPDDAVLATGGADSFLSLLVWGCIDGDMTAMELVDQRRPQTAQSPWVARMRCSAPVICTAFAPRLPTKNAFTSGSESPSLVAAGCMDGSVQLLSYYFEKNTGVASRIIIETAVETVASDHNAVGDGLVKHGKYVKAMAWSSGGSSAAKFPEDTVLFATSSADGTIHVYKVDYDTPGMDENGDDDTMLAADHVGTQQSHIKVVLLERLNFKGAVEALCFVNRTLVCYARETPHLACFDTQDDFKLRKINLNVDNPGGVCFDEHVSFAVMDIQVRRSEKSGKDYLLLATDKSRNIVMDFESGKQVRNLYGHSNEDFSQPKVGFSQNCQYVLGNTQENGSLCVWDISSEKIVHRIGNEQNAEAHSSPIRDIYSSPSSNTLVTVSFDKKCNIWFAS